MRRVLEREVATRAALVAGTPVLSRLSSRLHGNLDGLMDGAIYFPQHKALLSSDGGVCPTDGARLEFDPAEPERHRCGRCRTLHTGERHHRAWITRYHVWLSERAIHLVLLSAIADRPDLARRAGEVLAIYADRYHGFPNRDNVLGPARLFFSTYLESIWLIQIVFAAAMLDATNQDSLAASEWRDVRAMVREAAGLIAEFDEGWSNRQVWNNTAMLAAGAWLGDAALVARATDGQHGLTAQLSAVSPGGHWHEGENYHLFALRGFLLAGEWLRLLGTDLYDGTPLGAMYTAPLHALLPDLTLPARGDSPFGVSIRQPRFAELWELGRARTRDCRLDAVLAALYSPDAVEAADAGRVELAEQEHNRPAHRQYRDRLGWKALLWMVPEDPAAGGSWSGPTAAIDDPSVVVLRPTRTRQVSVECGQVAEGHGHPDALHLSVVWDHALLADFGTASYVSPSLHWYRSTLAHNAPGIEAEGQHATRAWCDALDNADGWSWCRVRAEGLLGQGTTACRTVIAGPDDVLDLVDVTVPAGVTVDLPVHPLGVIDISLVPHRTGLWSGKTRGHETGYDRVELLGEAPALPEPLTIRRASQAIGSLQLVARDGETILVASAPGPPGPDLADGGRLAFLVRRANGSGRWMTLYSSGVVRQATVEVSESAITVVRDGVSTRYEFSRDAVEIGREGRVVRLAGRRAAPTQPRPVGPIERVRVSVPLASAPGAVGAGAPAEPARTFSLADAHYRRSETPYPGPGVFAAKVVVVAHGDAVVFLFDVTKPDLIVRAADDPDPALDNETPDINSDGVQVYVGREAWEGYLVVPDMSSGGVRVRAVAGTAGDPSRVEGTFERTVRGYRLLVTCHTDRLFRRGDRFHFNAVVNEMRPGRERRTGQLALTGGGWVYLRGDREGEATALEGVIT